MLVNCNAKINIGLNIVAKRPDGYHDIETVFYPLPVFDTLEIVRSGKTELDVTGNALDCPINENIVLKAYGLLAEHYDIPPMEIRLEKNIPSGAGLGGGSSDAAFLLKAADKLAGLHIGEEKLCGLASVLGADCAFFIKNKPVFAHGKGDLFEPCDLSLKGLCFIVVKPETSVSTAEAYRCVKPGVPATSLRELCRLPVYEWKNNIVNDFEKSVFGKYPEIAQIKEDLYSMGAQYASMSGSGSAVYGIFESLPTVSGKFNGCKVFTGQFR